VLKLDFEVVILILVGVIWLANLLKKASQASKGPPEAGSRPPHEDKPGAAPRRSSLSEFFRTLREMSEEQAKPPPPQEPKVQEPRAEILTRTPPPPRKPPVPKRAMPRPVPVRQPTLREVKKPGRPPELELAPDIGVSLDELAIAEPVLSATVLPVRAQAPQIDAYAIKVAKQPRITQFLGAAISPSEVRKGIIMAEILGPAKALRRRRRPLPRR